MLEYVFLLTIWTAESPAADVYVMDSGMSGADCIAAIENYNATSPNWSRGIPSCEIDHATLPAVFTHEGQEVTLRPCEFEDSDNCYWDAGERGNGRGQSFYVINGQVFSFEP